MSAPYAYALPRPLQALLHFVLSLPLRLQYTSSWPHCLLAPRPKRALGLTTTKRAEEACIQYAPVPSICTGASPVRCAHQDAGHARAARDHQPKARRMRVSKHHRCNLASESAEREGTDVQCRGTHARPSILRTSMAARACVLPSTALSCPVASAVSSRHQCRHARIQRGGIAARGPSEGGRGRRATGFKSPRDFEKTKGAALRRG
ncbi:hypothetical protein FB451DRAFT_1281229 [Mycena latifolia]|nr:hypothetical protein FB451DRAFT_1281229 [Mycena latifolia]